MLGEQYKEHTFSYKRLVVWIKRNIRFDQYEPSFLGEINYRLECSIE